MRRRLLANDRLIRAAAQVAAASALLACSGGAGAQQQVRSVEFRGRDALDADVIEQAIATHPTGCRSALARPLCFLGLEFVRRISLLDSAQVALDAERIATTYEIQGYPGTTVVARIVSDGLHADVVFDIDEALPFRVRRLDVTGMPPGVPAPRELPLAVGDVYALPALDASIERIEFQLARHGYPHAAVSVDGSIDETGRSADLAISVEPGTRAVFGPVSIRADAPIDRAVIEERVAFESGQPFDPLLLERTERRLYELEAVGRAIVRVEGLSQGASELPVVIEVSPARLRGLEVESTLSTTDCLEGAAFWTHRHLGGRPRVVRVGAAVSNLFAAQLDGGFPCTASGTAEYGQVDYRGAASLDEPIPGTADTWARLELFVERQTAPDVFVERGFGALFRLSRKPNDDLGFAVEYRPHRFRLDAVDLYFCGNYGACEPGAPARLAGPSWIAPLTLSGAWLSDGELQGVTREKLSLWRLEALPVLRAELRGALEAAGPWSGSDFDYRRALVEGALTRRFGTRLEVAARARGGVVFGDGVLPPRVRLFAGGPGSVRGVHQNLLGPAALVADPRDLDRLGCAAPPAGCPAGHAVDPGLVRLRPLGGGALVEAALEARWSVAPRAQVAAFIDFGRVTSRDRSADDGGGPGGAPPGGTPTGSGDAARADWIIAPGVGIRLIAGIGAIRIDLAFDPRGPRTLPLRSASALDGAIEDLGDVVYDPFTHDDPSFVREMWRRMQLHVAIGQPF